ncbi:similar to Saccharomyces cerevisiae YBR163W EXO5 Mitochondrial 5'-3' exonuclease and sliding exonuclease, required for mitochondrial genome maintenance [Maudiozyma saulgeensis]|uniref:Exonuclease V, mitochondrial n=1 Tax=Maudiozyma saulgeensis TaxID=1789683 RepID=A0A1X7R6S0_9SACH|nr:similar to Saccharomyces cerevisiae YBR163W EXO5 Mitochondrial 5'-3' exonuclease and sliding exonuclease, required for mitochondrial genome maintenance [Kazachstania saulgeensis]
MLCKYVTNNNTLIVSLGRRLYSSNQSNIITSYEKDQLTKLPFFNESNIETDPLQTIKNITRQKKEYLKKKNDIVESIIGINSNDPPYLSYSFKGLPSMYDTITQNRIHGRLSVTKLMTKSWCELRYAYDVYSKMDKLTTRNISQGVTFHKTLEDTMIPENVKLDQFLKEQRIIGFEKTLQCKWIDTLQKLLMTFSNVGECREVLCHGYIINQIDSLQDGKFVTDVDIGSNMDQLILVSGIIDHLKWVPRWGNESHSDSKFDLFNDIFNDEEINNDLPKILSSLQREIPKRINGWKLQVRDVKTRQTFNIPNQTSVQRSTKLQIMYYRKFIEILSLNPKQTYKMLIINAQRRNLDVDQELDSMTIIALMMQNPMLIPDMRRLRDGKSIGFESYDAPSYQLQKSNIPFVIPQDIVSVEVRESFKEFVTIWKRPVTLRYFAARLAQTYHLLNSMLSEDLLVEYYCRGVNFHNLPFRNNDKQLIDHNADRTNFLFGKREVQPIEQNLRNFLTYCKHCDYQSVCSWKHEGEEKLKELGNELVEMWQDD